MKQAVSPGDYTAQSNNPAAAAYGGSSSGLTLTDLRPTPNKPASAFSPANSRKQPPGLDGRSSGRYEPDQSPVPWRQVANDPFQSPATIPPMMNGVGSSQVACVKGARAAQMEGQLAAVKRELTAAQQHSHILQGESVTVLSVAVC